MGKKKKKEKRKEKKKAFKSCGNSKHLKKSQNTQIVSLIRTCLYGRYGTVKYNN